MNAQTPYPFQALEVTLDQRSLIEASAGTGKTYSIALLALRLLLETKNEKGQPFAISEILMVTFTKYAVAELETRIRMFIRTALRICEQGAGASDEKDIITIVERSIKNNGKGKTTEWLKNAVITMDETAIMTIHSFCQQMLTEYAFDTEQTFGAKAISGGDYNDVIQQAVNECWRTHITTLSLPVLERLQPLLSIVTLTEMAQKTISGKQLWVRAIYDNQLTADGQQRFLENVKEIEKEIENICSWQIDYLEKNSDQLRETCRKNKTAQKWVEEQPELFEQPESLLLKIKKSVNKGKYVQLIFPEIIASFAQAEELETQLKDAEHTYYNQLLQFALHEITTTVARQKEKNGWISFDDMIAKVRDAVIVNDALCDLVRKKYKAVFIDEFQDTDSIQYEIFSRLFNQNTILFYIGDPKQSIYAFRKADMNTYFRARNEGVDRVLNMNTNYRSSASVIQALNMFFLPTPDFDTFHFDGSNDRIAYIEVEAPSGTDNMCLQLDGKALPPLSIIETPVKEDLHNATAAQVAELLKENYEFNKNGETSQLKPSDIGILVSTNSEARAIKKKLAYFKIPAVTLEDDKVLQTEQAREIYYVLHAVISLEKDKIQKALLTEIAGFTLAEMLLKQEEVVVERFKTYQQSLFAADRGVYVMLMKFINDHQFRERMLDVNHDEGERKLSNLIQLMELLNAIENKKQYAPHELLNWLGKAIEGKTLEGDEYVQRIDNDETAVKIITVHKSKGLEYKVVLAPNLDLDTQSKRHVHADDFRSEDDGQYYFDHKGILSAECEAWRMKQAEQENRRLLYVALTRAKYKCYIFTNQKARASSVKNFIHSLSENKPAGIDSLIVWEDPSALTPALYKYRSAASVIPARYLKADNFSLLDTGWRKMSYSALNPSHAMLNYPAEFSENITPYDQFIFNTLKKGAHTGNLLHFIFEQADFTDESQWKKIISKAARRLGARINDEETEGLFQMMQQVLRVPLSFPSGDFTLSSLSNAKKLNELEFDFPVNTVKITELEKLSPPHTPWRLQAGANQTTLQGIMNGKMDLFFEQKGKYYILDWKSNHLGYKTSDYDQAKVAEAMAANNYHLQYHLYTVALCIYLRWRIPDFDYNLHFGGVIYLFVRGVRTHDNHGIFYHKPDADLIQSMMRLMGC